MKKTNAITQVKQWIAAIGFRLFIWGSDAPEERYWDEIHEQEKKFKGECEKERQSRPFNQ